MPYQLTSKKLFFAATALCTALLAGCCTLKDCDDAEGIYRTQLEGYTWAEADTVQIVRFVEASGFSRVLDTVVQATPFRGNNIDTSVTQYEIDLPLPAGADYLISFPGAGRSHTVSGIRLEQRECNQCFLRQDYYTGVAGSVQDGQQVAGGRLILRR